MQPSKWDDPGPLITNDDNSDAPQPSSSELREARFGIGVSLLVMCIALVLMMIQLISEPSFEKCSTLENQSERYICYDHLREQLFRNPTKGGSQIRTHINERETGTRQL